MEDKKARLISYVNLATFLAIFSVQEHYYRERKLVRNQKTYYLYCKSRQHIYKYVVNANKLLLLLLLYLTIVRCYLQLSVDSR